MGGWIKRIPISVIAIALLIVPQLVMVLAKWHAVPMDGAMPTGPSDPDSWLRLTLVRDWLSGGGWFDHTVVNSNTPFAGIPSPWTRPLDLVIAGLVRLQPETVDLSIRLARAALLLPILWMTLLLLGIQRIVRTLTRAPAAVLMASLFVACMPMVWSYFGTGNADHHAPLAVLFIWALGVVFIPTPSRAQLVLSGLLLAMQLWISFEALILIAAIYGWYGSRWLRGDTQAARALAMLATTTAFAAAAALLIERGPTQWWLPVYDSISVVYVFVLLMAALLSGVMAALPRATLPARCTLVALGSAAILGALYGVYPLALHGPMAGVDPYVLSDFLPRVAEAQPLHHSPLPTVLAMLLYPLVALVLCALAWARPPSAFYTKPSAAPLLYFMAITGLLFLGQVRWCYYLYPLTVAVLAPVFGALFEPQHRAVRNLWPATWISRFNESGQAKRRVPLLLITLALPLGLGLLTPQYEAYVKGTAADTRSDACELTARQLIHNGALADMTGNKPLTILASTNLGAEILFWTKLRIVASNYHREGAGIHYVWDTFLIRDMAALRTHLAQRQINLLLLCPVKEPVAGSVLEALQRGARPPAWLKRLPYTMPPTPEGDDTVAGAAPVIFRVTR
ncbi:MAG: hypothetical protein V4735_01345 [Pseudomonadota bacterium]